MPSSKLDHQKSSLVLPASHTPASHLQQQFYCALFTENINRWPFAVKEWSHHLSDLSYTSDYQILISSVIDSHETALGSVYFSLAWIHFMPPYQISLTDGRVLFEYGSLVHVQLPVLALCNSVLIPREVSDSSSHVCPCVSAFQIMANAMVKASEPPLRPWVVLLGRLLTSGLQW